MFVALSLAFMLSMPVVGDTSKFDAIIEKVDSAAAAAKDGDSAMASIKAAAEQALKDNAADLATDEGLVYQGMLLGRANQTEAAYKLLVKYAADHKDSDLANRARVEAIVVGGSDHEPSELLKLANETKDNGLGDEQKQMLEYFKGNLPDDVKRGELNGKPCPAFEVSKVLNGTFDMKALKGKVVVIDFWATWCPPCRMVIPELVELQKEHKGDVQVVGATRLFGYGMDFSDPNAEKPHGGKQVGSRTSPIPEADEMKVNEVFIKAFEVNYPIVFTDAKVSKEQFYVKGIPTVFVIGKDGKVLGNAVGSGKKSHDKIEKLVKEGLAAKATG